MGRTLLRKTLLKKTVISEEENQDQEEGTLLKIEIPDVTKFYKKNKIKNKEQDGKKKAHCYKWKLIMLQTYIGRRIRNIVRNRNY